VAGRARGRAEAVRVAVGAGQAVLAPGDVLPHCGMIEVGGSPAFRRMALAAVAQSAVVVAVAVDAFGRSLAQSESLNGVAAAGVLMGQSDHLSIRRESLGRYSTHLGQLLDECVGWIVR